MPGVTHFDIQGQGGELWWIDNAGGVPWSAIANYGFNLMPGQPNYATLTSGSFLLSKPFDLTAAQTLTAIACLLTAHNFPWYDVGFGLLLKHGAVDAVLFANRPDGLTHEGDLGPNPGTNFATPTAGVIGPTVTMGGVLNLVLGGVNYGQTGSPADGTVSANITAGIKPGAGKYQLLFGMVALANQVNPARPAAMILEPITIV